MSPRYSIIPNAAIDELEGTDLKVLLVLGSHADDNGWCEKSQRKIGERLGVARETVNRSIKKLCGLGYIDKHDVRNAGQNICYYRVKMDHGLPPVRPAKAEGNTTSESEEVSITTSHPPCDVQITCDVQEITRGVMSRRSQHNDSTTKEKEAPAGASASHPPDPGPTSGAHYDARRDLALKLIAPTAAEAALQGGWLGKLFDFIVKHERLPDVHEFEAVKREAAQFQQNLQSMPPRIASSVAIRARNILRDIIEAQQPRSRAA